MIDFELEVVHYALIEIPFRACDAKNDVREHGSTPLPLFSGAGMKHGRSQSPEIDSSFGWPFGNWDVHICRMHAVRLWDE